MTSSKRELTLKESREIIDKYAEKDDMLDLKNHRKYEGRSNTFRFTVNVLSLDFIISLMEEKSIKNVYWVASVPPPGGAVDSISLRYKVFIEHSYLS